MFGFVHMPKPLARAPLRTPRGPSSMAQGWRPAVAAAEEVLEARRRLPERSGDQPESGCAHLGVLLGTGRTPSETTLPGRPMRVEHLVDLSSPSAEHGA